MILLRNLRCVCNLIKSDWDVFPYCCGGWLKMLTYALIGRYDTLTYLFWWRLCSVKNPFWLIAKLMHIRLSKSYGVIIPPNTRIGRAFRIYHAVGIVINPTAVIGNNCTIHQLLTIGASRGKSAVIGDNVWIGPNVCIVENVKIGNNVKIGAGTVVIKDIPKNCTSVGNPNRIIQK